MNSLLNLFSTKPRRAQVDEFQFRHVAPFGPSLLGPSEAEIAGRARLRPAAATVHPLYFNVRSFASGEQAHTLQFGFVDRDANVVLSVFVKAPSPTPRFGDPAHEDLSVQPLEPDAFERLLAPMCRGATLVGFHRVLQSGLLPSGAVRAAVSVECAWRRVQDAARNHRLCSARDRPVTLDDALALAGLPPLRTEDAVIRALAIRDLCLWLDRLG